MNLTILHPQDKGKCCRVYSYIKLSNELGGPTFYWYKNYCSNHILNYMSVSQKSNKKYFEQVLEDRAKKRTFQFRLLRLFTKILFSKMEVHFFTKKLSFEIAKDIHNRHPCFSNIFRQPLPNIEVTLLSNIPYRWRFLWTAPCWCSFTINASNSYFNWKLNLLSISYRPKKALFHSNPFPRTFSTQEIHFKTFRFA